MIAMQYSFVLPADYDMGIVRRRVDEKGHLLDDLPNLKFKAYLISEKKSGHASENTYAPFYVWENDTGMTDFICGSGFVGLSQSFGWPSVKSWLVWEASLTSKVRRARAATKVLERLPPYTNLSEAKTYHCRAMRKEVEERGAVASVAGFEPTTWSTVRFTLWESVPSGDIVEGSKLYEVRHVSAPAYANDAAYG